jgi:hypothetical protein
MQIDKAEMKVERKKSHLSRLLLARILIAALMSEMMVC